MRHLFILDPPDLIDRETDSSHLLMDEARRRGHEVIHEEYTSVGMQDGEVYCAINKIKDFDVVWIRKDPPIDRQYIEHLQMLSLAEGPLFVNDPATVLKYSDKVSVFNFSDFIPDTIVTGHAAEIEEFARKHGEIVIKPLNGFSGNDVRRIEAGEKIPMPEDFMMCQEFLPEVLENGDTRIHTVNGEIIGALRRLPQHGDFRGNIHAGGTGKRTDLTDEQKKRAKSVSKSLLGEGVLFAGLDFIGDKLTEINITSPGILKETNDMTGEELESKLFECLNLK